MYERGIYSKHRTKQTADVGCTCAAALAESTTPKIMNEIIIAFGAAALASYEIARDGEMHEISHAKPRQWVSDRGCVLQSSVFSLERERECRHNVGDATGCEHRMQLAEQIY